MNTLRTATALWQGTGQDGTGHLNTPTQFFHDAPYSFKSRLTDEAGTPGTNPEELRVEAAVALQVGAGITEAQFLNLAAGAKATCPIFKALATVLIHLDATLAA